MEEGRRKIRLCLFCVVMTAVLLGLIYYFTEMYQTENISEGTLVYSTRNYEEARWQSRRGLFI